MTLPSHYYQQQVEQGALHRDAQQTQILPELDRIYNLCVQKQKRAKNRWLRWLPSPIYEGLYIWGPVGGGKTLLLDLLTHCLPNPKKRCHFHEFMEEIHQALQHKQGTPNPLQVIAREIAQQTPILLFDEFLVDNIADAMILGQLLTALFAEKIILVATSNTAPENLYQDGLQREQFLPAIRAIEANTKTIALTNPQDYRLTHTVFGDVYFTPLNEASDHHLAARFEAFSHHQAISTTPIELYGYSIPVIQRTDSIIWFEFNAICGVPRSQRDYLALAQIYPIVFISHIPILESHQHNLVTALINLVDVFYDRNIKLVISAQTKPNDLYPSGILRQDFLRTASRLTEMQSEDYLQRKTK